MDQRPTIPLTQLINTIHTPDQNQENGKAQKAHKHLKLRRQPFSLAFLSVASAAPVTDRVIGREADEERHSEDLEAQARERDIDADVGAAGAVGGHAAAGGLQG